MARKADFTEQEWEQMQKGLTGAGMLVAVSDRSFLDTFKEASALGKHLAAVRQSNDSELVRELAEVRGTGFGIGSSPADVESATTEALRSSVATLESKASDEVESYRRFVLDVAQSVADAAGGGETAESGEMEKIRAALETQGATGAS